MSEKKTLVWREQLTSPLTWHYVAGSLLLVLVIVLGTRFALDWAATSAHTNDVLAGRQVELKALDLQTAPLRGLDKKVALTNTQIQDFYDKRIPAHYSSIESRIDELQVKSGVRLSRLQYAQGKPGNYLTEISMDAGISGDYSQIMKFVNSFERDKMFFIIRSMSLTGQQGGTVNLRLRVATWLRPAEVPNGLAQIDANSPSEKEAEQP